MEENLPSQNFFVELVKRNLLIFGLIFVGVILSGIGLVQYFSSTTAPEAQFVSGAESSEAGSDQVKSISVTIDVAGQVQDPGVYTLPGDSRLQDAIEAAGGFTSKADPDYIAKRINLAQKAIDGGKVYIPAVGEITTNTSVPASNQSTDASVIGVADIATGLIDINSATEKELDTLPRVGPVTAQKIIAGRPYMNIEELVAKKVMGQSTFDGLKDKITVQ